ncbi:MAG: MFS transporter [Rhodomicrobiaceae bacterium]
MDTPVAQGSDIDRHIRPALHGVAAIFFFNGALFGAWASRIPAIKERLALDEAALGLLLLCMAVGAVVSFSLAGRLTDRYGAAPVTFLTACAYGPLLVALGLAGNVWLLAIALFAFGSIHGGMDVAMNIWGTDVERNRTAPVLSRLHGLYSVGAGVGAVGGALFAAGGVGPLAHFAIFASACALPVLALAWRGRWVSLSRKKSPNAARGPEAPSMTIPRGPLLFVGLTFFASAIGEGAMADWSAVYLVEVLSTSEATGAIGFGIFSAAMVTMRFSGDVLIQRLGRVACARICGIVAATGALTVAAAPTVWACWTGMGLLGLGYSLIAPLAFARAAADPDHSSGTAMAAVSTLGYGGFLLGPPLIGFVAAASSLRVSIALLAGLALMITLLAAHLHISGSRREPGTGRQELPH